MAIRLVPLLTLVSSLLAAQAMSGGMPSSARAVALSAQVSTFESTLAGAEMRAAHTASRVVVSVEGTLRHGKR